MSNLDGLNIESKKVFMKALAYVANSDGEFDEDEKEFIKSLCEIVAIGKEHFDEIFQNRGGEEVVEMVKKAFGDADSKIKMNLIRDMFTIANSDGDLSDEEVIFIANIGEALDISLETLEEISEWVIDGIEWRLKGEALFGEDF